MSAGLILFFLFGHYENITGRYLVEPLLLSLNVLFAGPNLLLVHIITTMTKQTLTKFVFVPIETFQSTSLRLFRLFCW